MKAREQTVFYALRILSVLHCALECWFCAG